MGHSIKEASKISGVSAHTLRFYDRQGLFPFIGRKRGGVREFSGLDME